ncbi:hypothetical protein DPMN_011323 [Dreissena polymorpha]|uniref:Uncharacterized protein n=1 Tax=Dreissena polymorpha TaxID=45954 RepID=A0A9D4S1T5_DREPO|nr:hypothetical protein DPMN_011323 [Dreissena polymorpha]
MQLFQLYNAVVLFMLSRDPQCTEWQVSTQSGRSVHRMAGQYTEWQVQCKMAACCRHTL